MTNFGNNFMEKEEILFEIGKKLDLDAYDYETLTHDVNNLRGAEWLDEVASIGDKKLLKAFKKII